MTAAPLYVGHAPADAVGGSGWFLGQFVPPEAGLRHQTDVELKWGIHAAGERRPGGRVVYGVATTVSVLLRGTFRLVFHDAGEPRDVVLREPGDYVVFGPGLAHDWEAVTDCVVLSVRFPSVDARIGASSPLAG